MQTDVSPSPEPSLDETGQRLANLSRLFSQSADGLGMVLKFLVVGTLVATGFLPNVNFPNTPLPESPGRVALLGILAIAVCMAVGLGFASVSRSLLRRDRYGFCVAMSLIACLLVPLGPILGIRALRELARAETRSLFGSSRAGAATG